MLTKTLEMTSHGVLITEDSIIIQQFVQANTKWPAKLRVAGPFWEQSNGDWWIPLAESQ